MTGPAFRNRISARRRKRALRRRCRASSPGSSGTNGLCTAHARRDLQLLFQSRRRSRRAGQCFRGADLFAQNVRQSLSADAIQGAFDKAFGAGAGERVTVNCQGGVGAEIGELVVSLAGDVAGSAPISDLSWPLRPRRRDARRGLVVQPAP